MSHHLLANEERFALPFYYMNIPEMTEDCQGEIMNDKTKKFIEKAKSVHGDKYDYSLVDYKNCDTKVKIICKKEGHGVFEQTPYGHSIRYGCPVCKTMTKNEFIEKANLKHDYFYNYSLVIYKNNKTKIKIMCPYHGEFEQTPDNHLRGHGCMKCFEQRRFNTQTNIIERFIKKFGTKFIYIFNKEFNSMTTNITIICPTHGCQLMTPNKHLLSLTGCAKCGLELVQQDNIKTTDEFIEEANIIHGNKYGYHETIYKKGYEKIKIYCKIHKKIFEQTPANHLKGQGCPSCSKNISKLETEWLNYMGILPEYRNKRIIINGKTFQPDGIDTINKIIYEFYGDIWHGNPKTQDPTKLNRCIKKTYKELYNKTILRETFLKNAGWTIISIWESDWNEHKKEGRF